MLAFRILVNGTPNGPVFFGSALVDYVTKQAQLCNYVLVCADMSKMSPEERLRYSAEKQIAKRCSNRVIGGWIIHRYELLELLDVILLLKKHPYEETVKVLTLFGFFNLPLRQALLERWRIKRLEYVCDSAHREQIPQSWAKKYAIRKFSAGWETNAEKLIEMLRPHSDLMLAGYGKEQLGKLYSTIRVLDQHYSIEPSADTIRANFVKTS